jgi:predicted DNA-binding ribbon-helix-helix protein
MAESKMRTLELAGTKRTGIRLDSTTWQAIDWIAEKQGKKWSEWARGIIQNHPDADNMTAVIREAAMNELLMATVLGPDRGQDLAALEANTLTRNSAMLDDRQLDDFMKTATIQGESDFVAFRVIFGHDEYGADFLVIKNAMRDALHFATLAAED